METVLSDLRKSLTDLVENFESNQENPLLMKDYPQAKVEHHIQQITGFSAKPTLLRGIAKHHQNASSEEVKSVIYELNKNGNTLLAEEIKKEHCEGHLRFRKSCPVCQEIVR